MRQYSPKGTSHMVHRNSFEPQRNNNFEIQITDLGTNDATKIRLSVASYSAPQINISPINITYGNSTIKFAGKPEFPDSNVVVNDYIGLDIEKVLTDWQKKVYNPETEKIGFASNYKKDAYLIEYSPNGSVYSQWRLEGCWPSQLQFGDFNQDGNAVRQVTMTITYDRAYLSDDRTRNNVSKLDNSGNYTSSKTTYNTKNAPIINTEDNNY